MSLRWLALALVPGSLSCSALAPSQAPVPQTIVLVTIDTLRADRLGSYGKSAAQTATFDRWASEGMLFERAFTTAPLTLPAHASILSGRSMAAHGVFNNGTFRLAPEVPTLAEALRRAGFRTGAFVSAPVLSRIYGLDRGFDTYDDQIPKTGPAAVRHFEERSAPATIDRALAFLAAAPDQPAFVWLHLYEPHRPYSPPPEIAASVAGDRYQGEVVAVDRALAGLAQGLTTQRRWDRSLLVLTADHGEGLGEHGEATHGTYLYNSTLHVPLIFRGPSFGISPGRSSELASVSDLAPTILALLSLPGLAGADGVSLAGLLARTESTLQRTGVAAESHVTQLEFGWSGLRAWTTRSDKLIQAPRPELYAAADHAELNDLSSDSAQVVSQRLSELDAALQTATAVAPARSDQSVSAEQQEVLRSLGYVASGAQASSGPLVDRAATDPKDRVEFLELFDRAVLATQAGRLDEALPLFDQLTRIEAKNRAVLFELGQAQIRAQRLDQAKATYRQLVEAHPSYALGWFRLGQLLDNAQDWAGAEASYRTAIAADPLGLDARKALAGMLIDRKRLQEAIVVLEEARQVDPNDPIIKRDLERLWAASKRR